MDGRAALRLALLKPIIASITLRSSPKKVASIAHFSRLTLHPRSIRFSTTEVQSALRAISGSNPGWYSNEAERLAGKVVEKS